MEDVIYPAVPGGKETLAALLREYEANRFLRVGEDHLGEARGSSQG